MKTIWHSKGIDLSDVLEHLIDGEAIKIYFHNSLEALTMVKIKDIFLIQNNEDKVVAIHDLQDIGIELNGNLLEVLIDTSLYENDTSKISFIETVDFQMTLMELD